MAIMTDNREKRIRAQVMAMTRNSCALRSQSPWEVIFLFRNELRDLNIERRLAEHGLLNSMSSNGKIIIHS